MSRRSRTFLGDFELTVMLAVLRLGDQAYGAAIIREIEEQTGRSVTGGALYVTLDRIEAKKLIKSRMGLDGENRGGRPRRYIEITATGLDAVRESSTAILNLLSGLDATFRQS